VIRFLENVLGLVLFVLLRPVWIWLRDRSERTIPGGRCDGGEAQNRKLLEKEKTR
jgi:hypothetical protein